MLLSIISFRQLSICSYRSDVSVIDQIAQAESFQNIVDHQVMLAESKEDVTKAPRLPVCVVVSLETAVTQEENPKVSRIVAWMRLLKVYGVLRTDDLQRIVPDDVLYSETGLTATLRRTETSGAGKKVRALTLFIPDFASISGEPWLGKASATRGGTISYRDRLRIWLRSSER